MALAAWRLRNRDRSLRREPLAPEVADVVDLLRRDGVVITEIETLLGERGPYERAAAEAAALHARPRPKAEAEAGSKESFKTKLASGTFPAGHPFVDLALHPRVLAAANSYLQMRSTLRALELWLTEPSPGPAIQTQLWHRDADDVMNVKLFVYFNDVGRGAGPFTYAPRTHPIGNRRIVPDHDEQARSNDDQLASVVPEREWLVCEGAAGTAILTDTCGYHKQLKPDSAERLMLVAHYVSGTPLVPNAVELRDVDADSLTDEQHVAVFDRPRG